jgi:hypothetical protein
MMRWLRPFVIVFPFLGGCSVTEVPLPDAEVAQNQCEGPADCPGGACSTGACFATRSDIQGVIVEVTPPPDGVLTALPFYKELKESGDIVLQPDARLTGFIYLHPESCTPAFFGEVAGDTSSPVEGTIPVDVTFRPSVSRYGLPAPTYRGVRLTNEERKVTPGGKHGFKVQLPPGDYDVYIQPALTTPESSCPIPPWLLLDQRIASSGNFDVNLSLPSQITVPVHWPTASLDFWSVELIDSVSGRILSSPSVLANPGQDDEGRAFYVTSFSYSRVLQRNSMNELEVSPDSYGIVRLVPPVETIAPTILGEASAVGLVNSNEGGFALTTSLPNPVTIEGQTAEAGTTKPIPATVTLTATRLEGMAQGVYGSFSRTFPVDATGIFRARVPPGDYRVDAIPRFDPSACTVDGCPRLASRRDTWQVGVDPEVQAGKVIQFQRAPTVQGEVFSAAGKPVTGAAVRATASAFTLMNDEWDSLDGFRGGDGILPQATTGLVDVHGSFEFRADPGMFDFFVQPDSSTRFGWYVRPLFTVDQRDVTAPVGSVTLPLARGWSGKVLVGSNVRNQLALANALLRAYVYVTREGEYSATRPDRGALLQVAETRSNAAGDFELLIPASLDSPMPPAD